MSSPSSSPLAQAAEALRGDLECALCFRLYFEPIALVCGHTYCRSCLARALRSAPACPLCRAHCFLDPARATRNLALEAVVGALFPAESAARRSEHAREDEELASNRLGLFYVAGATHRLFPGMPLELVVFEPRYLLLMDRVMEAGALFGVAGAPDELVGAAVRIEACRRLPNGRMLVSASVRSRFRALQPPAVEEGTYGLHYAQSVFFDDDAAVAAAAALPLDAAALELFAPEGLHALSRRSRAALLGGGAGSGRGALTEPQACAVLRDELAEACVRFCSALSHSTLQRLHARYGQLPSSSGPGASPERWSHYVAAIVALSVDERRACYETARTLRRLVVCFAALERVQREARRAGARAGANEGESGGGGGDDDDAAEAGLRPLTGLEEHPELVLDMLRDSAGLLAEGGPLGRFVWWLMRSPAVSNLIILLGAGLMLVLLSRSNNNGVLLVL